MLLSLQSGLHKELRASINHLATRVGGLEERSHNMELQISEMVAAHNEVVDVHELQAETIHKLQIKVEDLKDRSRRNNIKLRGISEAVKRHEIVPLLKQLFLKLLPDLSS